MRNTTLEWYKENAAKFLSRTSSVDMTSLYEGFLNYMVPGGRIMDLGCGSGVASLYFVQHGFDVLPIDGCKEMCDAATKLTGCQARQMLFNELDYVEAFDGIWACASLLHVPKNEMIGVLSLVKDALRNNGIFYASFKYGTDERKKNGRLFSDYTAESMNSLIDKVSGLDLMDLWITNDARQDRTNEKWLNMICKRVE